MMKLLWAAACVVAFQGIAPASAQPYPSKPVTIVVPFAAGGPADTLARMLGDRMKSSLGQAVVVENVAGAAGSIGVGRVARAAPDGHTIGIGHLGTHVFNGALYDLQYDLLKDLEPIALLPSYRSGAAAFGDVLAGHVSLIFDQFTGSSVEMYRRGQVRPFAVTAKSRLPSLPDIPTVDEAGIPGLYVSTWYGLWAPKGTSKEIVAKLNAAVLEALAEPELRKRLDAQSSVVPPREQQTPESLGAFQRAEIDKWWPTIKAANIKPEQR